MEFDIWGRTGHCVSSFAYIFASPWIGVVPLHGSFENFQELAVLGMMGTQSCKNRSQSCCTQLQKSSAMEVPVATRCRPRSSLRSAQGVGGRGSE